jgi:hypothetical protein
MLIQNVLLLSLMKKILAISLAIVYLAIASGVVVNVHYCMGEVASVALGHSESDRCGNCGMDNDGCCNDEVTVVKIQDSHSVVSLQADFPKAEALQQKFPQAEDFTGLAMHTYLAPQAHAPPGGNQLPLHVQYCVFRI